jgi:hypothetical protein
MRQQHCLEDGLRNFVLLGNGEAQFGGLPSSRRIKLADPHVTHAVPIWNLERVSAFAWKATTAREETNKTCGKTANRGSFRILTCKQPSGTQRMANP